MLDPQLLQEQAFPYGFARRKELGFELLRILCEIAPLRKDALDFLHHSERLLPIFTFVDEHMHESISVADLADLINLSLSRFYVFFKAQMCRSTPWPSRWALSIPSTSAALSRRRPA